MIFNKWVEVEDNYFLIDSDGTADSQLLTNDAFSEKWDAFSAEEHEDQEKLFEFQKSWFLDLYGFESEQALANYLRGCKFVLDAGCGLGYKSAWFASLAPDCMIIGVDFSAAAHIASVRYRDTHRNLIFATGDIANLKLPKECLDFVVCDQVIMHTQDPGATLQELSRITASWGEICCYWYRKKAIPRELLDEHFRGRAGEMSTDDLWALSKEVMLLGKHLSELNITANFPSVPSLGIVGGEMNLQRFLYWNFIKCFWNEDLGYATSLSTNFDWYSPVHAKRFSLEDVEHDVKLAGLRVLTFHEEEACFSGRFKKSAS